MKFFPSRKHIHAHPKVPRDATDVQILAALREANPGALEVLFDQHARHVRAFVAQMLSRDQEREDVFQEVFLRAWQLGHSCRGTSSLRTWLLGIAVNVVREHLHRKKRKGWLTYADPPETVACDVDFDARSAVRSLYEFMNRLPLDERIPFGVRKLAGLDLMQTAQLCNMSMATLRRRLANAELRFESWRRERPALDNWLKEEVYEGRQRDESLGKAAERG